MWKQSYFWFNQPSSILANYDYYFLWFFIAVLGLGIIFKVVRLFISNIAVKKLFSKYANLGITIGLLGVAWFGLRYENTPIFANRYWAAIIVLILFIWKAFILKYLVLQFAKEKREYEKQQINSRYIAAKK